MRRSSFAVITVWLLILVAPTVAWTNNDNQSSLLLSFADIPINSAIQDLNPDLSQSQNVDERQKVKNSVQSISKSTNAQEQQAADECDATIQRLCREADSRVQELEEAMQESITANRNGYYKQRYSIELLNDAIKQDYTERIDAIKSSLSWKINRIKAAYAEKEKALEDAASSLEKSYVKGPSGNVLLIPDNSNVYVRNYQIDAVPANAASSKLDAELKARKLERQKIEQQFLGN